LARARERGYLDARRAGAHRLLRPYALWCWRLKLPVVWLEKRARYSKYARVHLDMFTTADQLTARGQFEVAAIGASPPAASAHDASWDRVPIHQAARLAHEVMRTSLRSGNREPNHVKRPARLFSVGPPAALEAASAAS
jgi:hypothetical protein